MLHALLRETGRPVSKEEAECIQRARAEAFVRAGALPHIARRAGSAGYADGGSCALCHRDQRTAERTTYVEVAEVACQRRW